MSQRKISTFAFKMPNLILFTYGIIRMTSCIIHNVYCIPSYLFLNSLQWPLYYISIRTYSKIENFLYYALLYIVGWWSYGCGMIVHEHGDDIHQLREKHPNVRLLLIANHQSTADVPLMFQAFASRSEYSLLWIMDRLFKWTNFGIVSQVHGDYFLNPKKYINDSILNHCKQSYSTFKDMIIIFPEGGFRYKRLQSSIIFASKKNYPTLKNVTYPRVNGFRELLNEDLNITHVVDLTICYDDPETVPSILDVVRGINKSDIHFYYKIYSVKDTDNIDSEEWLYEQWQKKEALLINHYAAIKRRNNNKNEDDMKVSKSTLISGDQEQFGVEEQYVQLRKREKTPPHSISSKFNNDENDNKENGSILNNHEEHNSNKSIHDRNGSRTSSKFRPFQEFSSLQFDLNKGRPVKLSILKVLSFHLGFLFVTITLYAIVIWIMTML